MFILKLLNQIVEGFEILYRQKSSQMDKDNHIWRGSLQFHRYNQTWGGGVDM